LKCNKKYYNPKAYSKSLLLEVLRVSKWLGISNFIGPILLHSGRFILLFFTNLETLGIYSLAFDMSIKLLIIPTAICTVLLPKFSIANNFDKSYSHYIIALISTSTIMIVISIIFYYLIRVYINFNVFDNSSIIINSIMILIFGIVFSSAGHITQTFLQAIKRTDLTGKLHLVELCIYLIYATLLTYFFGLNGGLISWSLRMFISTTCLILMPVYLFNKNSAMMNKVNY